MRELWIAYKPAAPARIHLLLAAVMWSGVGSALLVVGVRWLGSAHVSHMVLTLGMAVFLGVLKSRLILCRTAQKTISRIRIRGDGRCLGGFLSWQSWTMVLLMAVGGRLLRASGLPTEIIAFVYVTVGVALLIASLSLWHGWYQQISVDAECE